MRSPPKAFTKLLLPSVLIMAVAIGAFIWRGLTDQRSFPGHIVRRLNGESGALQELNDIAGDIRNKPNLSQLQSWGTEMMMRFRDGQVSTNGDPFFWLDDRKAIRLSPSERPEFIRHQWGETNSWGQEEPELLIVLGKNNQPEVAVVAWYSHGIEIGLPTYRMPYKSWYGGLYVEVVSGVYVYNNYK